MFSCKHCSLSPLAGAILVTLAAGTPFDTLANSDLRGPRYSEAPTTLPGLFARQARNHPGGVAYRAHDGKGWRDVTWRQELQAVENLTAGLHVHGLRRGHKVALLGPTEAAWHRAARGIQGLGAVPVGLDRTLADGVLAQLLAHSGAQALFVHPSQQERVGAILQAYTQRADRHPTTIPKVYSLDARAHPGEQRPQEALTLGDLIAGGREARDTSQVSVKQLRDAISPDAPAAMVFTSGTTTTPKGARDIPRAALLSHASYLAVLNGIIDTLDLRQTLPFAPVILPLAPHSHVAGQIVLEAMTALGGTAHYLSNPLDVKGSLKETIQAANPALFFGVPALYQSLQSAVEGGLVDRPALVRRLFGLAGAVSRRIDTLAAQNKRAPGYLRWIDGLLEHRVRAKARAEVFGSDLKVAASGGAAIGEAQRDFFRHYLGVDVLDAYGQTEFPVALLEPGPGQGLRPLPGVEARLTERGELLLKGPGRMLSYHENRRATRQAVDALGWLHTGDIFEKLPNGALKYLRRDSHDKTQVTSEGWRFRPEELERALVDHVAGVFQAVVDTKKQNRAVALLTLDPQAIKAHLPAEYEAHSGDPTRLASSPVVRKWIAGQIAKANKQSLLRPRIKAWDIVPLFAPDADQGGRGLATPKMTIRRARVKETYSDLLERLRKVH